MVGGATKDLKIQVHVGKLSLKLATDVNTQLRRLFRAFFPEFCASALLPQCNIAVGAVRLGTCSKGDAYKHGSQPYMPWDHSLAVPEVQGIVMKDGH